MVCTSRVHDMPLVVIARLAVKEVALISGVRVPGKAMISPVSGALPLANWARPSIKRMHAVMAAAMTMNEMYRSPDLRSLVGVTAGFPWFQGSACCIECSATLLPLLCFADMPPTPTAGTTSCRGLRSIGDEVNQRRTGRILAVSCLRRHKLGY